MKVALYDAPKTSTVVIVLLVLFLTFQNLFFGCKEGMLLSATRTRTAVSSSDFAVAATTATTNVTHHSSWDLTPTTYSWIGDKAWAPPRGVSYYNSAESREIWERYNVLWVGDSTCRQDWATMWAIMYDAPRSNTSAAVPNEDVTTSDLNQQVNVNKRVTTEFCHRRDFQTNASLYRVLNPVLCRNTQTKTKFDIKFYNCHGNVLKLEDMELQQNGINTTTKLSDEYDVLIISMGTWEIEKAMGCTKEYRIANATERVFMALDHLNNGIAAPHLKILWKTLGLSDNEYKFPGRVQQLNEGVREWFHRNNPRHLYLLDFTHKYCHVLRAIGGLWEI